MSSDGYAINGKEYYLSKVFSSDFQYFIPDYQRPYSWEKEHIKRLFDDLYEFYQRNTEEDYFLGSIVVIKQDKIPKSDVVDGQQRLTSLTILFAALASYLKGNHKESIKNYIQQAENPAEDIPAQPRLTLRKLDNEFFNKYIQDLKLDQLNKLNAERDCKTDAQKNILENAISLLNLISEKFKISKDNISEDKNSKYKSLEDKVLEDKVLEDKRSEIFKFFKFLINKCCLVIVSTSSQKSAFRIFSVMNDRGLDLLLTDILKADLIGKITDTNKRNEYTEKWESSEQELGRDSFKDLFSHIRMIKLKEKAGKSILEELQEKVFINKTDKEICAFIDEELTSYVDVFSALKNNHYPAEKHQQEISQYIQWLNRVGFSEWIPVAILFLHQKPNNDETLEFLRKLEMLTAYLHLSAQDINSRIKRYGQILESLGEKAKNGGDSLLLSDEEKRQFKALLNGDIYNKMTSVRRNYLILRLDSMVSDGAATYNSEYGLLTIEHVLPQTLEENTQWYEWWVDESKENEAEKYHQHQLWLHRLANLVPLNKRRNSAASNWDFGEKINKYFRGNENVSSYALTTQVLKQSEWRPKDVEERQKNLLERICEVWDLPKD
ncbi:DUF262 domain-containing protein [Gallibacterium anatis]|uniref:DUF262 domain-containing protein n=1 Tax=Gallibacterium anatis 4895 TaxID=1396510 RepID=A0A0A2ZZL1_9PAST|nr:DUF262 domain-containing protein [Gallibacterium anatis]KGQ60907.1 hypothetical protein IO48_09175 [Gallibacterium anatis 4895]